jgi:ubiquinone biosynthesis monooxygenase Coq7
MALPGDKSHARLIDEILRVDHAGEYGAQQIYKGQLAVLGKDACAPLLQEMMEQEQEHLQTFEELIRARSGRPTALLPFWHVAGFALGAGTALIGKEAAMACTVAVESVIADHYQEQMDALGEDEKELRDTITRFRADEIEHHDTGLEQGAEQAPAYRLLSDVIRTGCKVAIAVAKRV